MLIDRPKKNQIYKNKDKKLINKIKLTTRQKIKRKTKHKRTAKPQSSAQMVISLVKETNKL